MRIFITGANGYVGGAITEQALAAGHEVYGLSRQEPGDTKLRALGATPVRGDLMTLDVLREQSAEADAVLHLAWIAGMADYEEVLRLDAAAVNALSEPLRGTSKPLVITSGSAVVAPDPAGGETTEEAPLSETFFLKDRVRSEHHALSLSNAGESIYVGEGQLRTSSVHVDDAAALYLLAAEQAEAGDVFNATSSTAVTVRELAEAIGAVLQLPVRSVSLEEAEPIWGGMTSFVQHENRASSRKAMETLGWQPKEADMLTDIRTGSYRLLVENTDIRSGTYRELGEKHRELTEKHRELTEKLRQS